MPIRTTDIAWVAGILEGEGSFGCSDNGSALVVKLAMNDRDVVYRAKHILNCDGKVGMSLLSSGNWQYIIRLTGNRAIQWMMTIYCFMGIRRRARIKEILTLWNNRISTLREQCTRGHRYTESNTYIMPNGYRSCKLCRHKAQLKANTKRRMMRRLSSAY